MKLDTLIRQNVDFHGFSAPTYIDHVEVKPVLRDVMSIQDFGKMPAADIEMAIGDGLVAMARSLIGKLRWMTTSIRPDLSKKLNDAHSVDYETNT